MRISDWSSDVCSSDLWVGANVASFQRLLKPITDKLGDKMEGSRTGGLARRAAGLEVGLLLGWMSGRVLGQYDLLVIDDPAEASPEDQDLVYYVGPNVLALEKRLDRKSTRLNSSH